MRIYFLHMKGCPACDAAKPALSAFQRRHPEVQVVKVDLLDATWTDPWTPEVTPTYVAEVIGRPRVQWAGGLDEGRLEKFLTESKRLMGLR